jgi:membrane associated rhomboid family serine protease
MKELIRRPFKYSFYNASLFLIAGNVLIFLLNRLAPQSFIYLGLFPQLVVQRGFVWQIFTYMFVHGGFWHILFNMLGLFIFGVPLERRMGSSEFLLFYLTTGLGTGLFSLLAGTNVVGASGAIYGLLLGFATYFPQARLLVFGIIPLRAPLAVVLFAGLSIAFQVTGAMGGVAHLAHLAGIILGYLYFVIRLGINPVRVFLEKR